MAIYRIFPEKDTFIFSEQNTGNAGKDEIVEVGGYTGVNDGTGQKNRIQKLMMLLIMKLRLMLLAL